MNLMERMKYALLLIALLSLAACGGTVSSDEAVRDTDVDDPRIGWVLVDNTDYDALWKTCDDSTLVYKLDIERGGGLAVIPNSPECGYNEDVAE